MPRERCCRKLTSGVGVVGSALLALAAPLKAEERSNGADYFASGNLLYDDNLFRQPADSTLLSGSSALHRNDLIERVSAGLQGQWTLARQTFELKAQGDGNRFEHNDN